MLQGPLKVLKASGTSAPPKAWDYDLRFFALTATELRIGVRSVEEALGPEGLVLPVKDITSVEKSDALSMSLASDALAPGTRLVIKAVSEPMLDQWFVALNNVRGVPTPVASAVPLASLRDRVTLLEAIAGAGGIPLPQLPNASPPARTSNLQQSPSPADSGAGPSAPSQPSQPNQPSQPAVVATAPFTNEPAVAASVAQPEAPVAAPPAQSSGVVAAAVALGAIVLALYLFLDSSSSAPDGDDPMLGFVEPDLRRRSAGIYVQVKPDDSMSLLGILAAMVVSCGAAMVTLGLWISMPAVVLVDFVNASLGLAITNDESGHNVVVGDVSPEAASLGVKPGAIIRQVNGRAVRRDELWTDVVETIRASPRPIKLAFEQPQPDRAALGAKLMLRGAAVALGTLAFFWSWIFPPSSSALATPMPANFVRVDGAHAAKSGSSSWGWLLLVGAAGLAAAVGWLATSKRQSSAEAGTARP